MVKQLKNEPAHSFTQYTKFITRWKVEAGDEIRFNVEGTFDIEWGDGDTEKVIGTPGILDTPNHVYLKGGEYTISISNGITWFCMRESPKSPGSTPKKLIEIKHWGDAQWKTMDRMFSCAENMVCNAVDTPDVSKVKNARNMFQQCKKFNSPIEDWGFKQLTDVRGMLQGAEQFNQPLAKIELRLVKYTDYMLVDTPSFNQDLGDLKFHPSANVKHLFGQNKSLDEYNEEYEAKEEKDKFNDVLK